MASAETIKIPLLAALKRSLQSSPSRARIIAVSASGVVSILLAILFHPGLNSIEERVGALGWTMRPDLVTEERVALVVIDEASIHEIGPWPWPRSVMASLVDSINAAGAQLQLHDITYPEQRDGDNEFISALERLGTSIIAQVPALGRQEFGANAGLMTHPILGLNCDDESAAIPEAIGYIASADVFRSVPKGHNAALIDADGAVRKTPALVCVDGAAFPALSISAFLQASNANEWEGDIRAGNSFFDPPAILTLDGYPGFEIPLDENGAIRISFSKSPEAFFAISAADIIKGRVVDGLLDGAWVVLGGTAFGMADIVPTPYSGATYGVELQARLLTSMLDDSVPYTPLGGNFILAVTCLLIGFTVLGIASIGEKAASYGLPLAIISMPLLTASFHAWVLSSTNLWIGWITPAIFGSLSAVSVLLVELGRVRLERSRVFVNLNSYLPSNVAKEIAFSLPSSSVNAHRSNATLLSADLRNFSAFGEARPPEETAALLHFFFMKAAAIIEAESGRVQEYRGDGILAIWDGTGSATAHKALRAAESLQDSLSGKLLPEHALKGLEPLALGIGLEQGPVLTGSIGPAHRRSHTLLGDTVSIVLRIQEMTVELAQPILLGECVARQLSDSNLEPQGSYLLPGLRTPHTLFAPATSTTSELKQSSPQKFSVVAGGKR